MENDAATKILTYLDTRLKPQKPLAPQDPLISSGLLDSLAIYEFVSFLESTFELRFSDTEMVTENFETAAAACRLVATKSAAR